jgi:Protein of unknown function (DUF1223)
VPADDDRGARGSPCYDGPVFGVEAMKSIWAKALVLMGLAGCAACCAAYGQGEPPAATRKVLVELYTSQGCDMCPQAEEWLGALAQRNHRIVPIAFHVDYFNDPWKDVFSDALYSRRQMTYNQLYTKPKNAEYGLYYTPPQYRRLRKPRHHPDLVDGASDGEAVVERVNGEVTLYTGAVRGARPRLRV